MGDFDTLVLFMLNVVKYAAKAATAIVKLIKAIKKK